MIRHDLGEMSRAAYDFEELAFHGVFPALALHFVGDTEDLLDGSWDHAHRHLSLNENNVEMKKDSKASVHTEPPSIVNDLPEPV